MTIDCDYVLPQVACAYLRIQGDEAAFIETNTTHAVPKLLSTLAAEGMKPEQVRYVIITHVHLDHAGGTSALLAACPNATVLAHPRAARHLVDPEKLVASARAVYGEAKFDALYGKIVVKSSKYHAHDEKGEYHTGDVIEIQESKPISRTKNWVVTRLVEKAAEV